MLKPTSSAPGSAVARSQYCYQKLDYVLGQEIRLVGLRLAQPSDTVYCDVVHVNFEDKPIYDAISYTWATEGGDATLSKLIHDSNGGSVKVTANCEAVLRQLRRRGTRQVWIDAICIDQGNTNERDHQVGLMSAIYSNVWRVIICINDVTPDQSEQVAPKTEFPRLFRWLKLNDSAESSATQDPSITTSLKRLVPFRYFQRV